MANPPPASTKAELEIKQKIADLEQRIVAFNAQNSAQTTADVEQARLALESKLEGLKQQQQLEEEATALRREQIEDLKKEIAITSDKQEKSQKILELKRLELKELKEIKGLQDQETKDKEKEVKTAKEILENTRQIKKVEAERIDIGKKIYEGINLISGGIFEQIKNMFSFTGLLRMFGEVVVGVEKASTQLVASTGQLGMNFTGAAKAVAGYGITYEKLNLAGAEVFRTMSGFTELNPRMQTQLTISATKLEKLGISASVTGKNYNELTKTLRMSAEEAMKTNEFLAQSAIGAGIAPQKMLEEFASSMPKLAVYGKQAVDVFISLQKQAKGLGMEMSSLTNIVGDQFDTFEGSAKAAGRLNAILGGNYLNSVDMLNASEEERVLMIRRAMEESGKSFDSLDKYGKKALAASLNVSDMGEASKIFGTSSGEVSKQMDKQASTQDKLNATLAATATAMEKLEATMKAQMVGPATEVSNVLKGIVGQLTDFISRAEDLSRILAAGLIISLFSLIGVFKLFFSTIKSFFSGGDTFKQIGQSIGNAIEKIGESISKVSSTKLILGILAIGAAFLMIGYGIKIASEGLATLVEAFAGLTGPQAAAAVAGLVVVMTGFVAIIAVLGAVMIAGPGAAAAIGLLALGAAFLMIAVAINLAADSILKLKPVIIELGKIVMDGLVKMFDRLMEALQNIFPYIENIVITLIKELGSVLRSLAEIIGNIILGAFTALKEIIIAIYEPIVKIADIIGNVLIKSFESLRDIVQIVANAVKDTMLGVFDRIISLTEKENIGTKLAGIGAGLITLAGGMGTLIASLKLFPNDDFDRFAETAKKLADTKLSAEGVDALATSIRNFVSGDTKAAIKETPDLLRNFTNSFIGFLGLETIVASINFLSSSLNTLTTSITTLFNTISGKLTGFGFSGFSNAIIQMNGVIITLIETLNQIPDNKTLAIKTLTDNVSTVKELKQEDLKPVREFVSISKEYYEVQAKSKDADKDALIAALKELRGTTGEEGEEEAGQEIKLVINGADLAEALSFGNRPVKGLLIGGRRPGGRR